MEEEETVTEMQLEVFGAHYDIVHLDVKIKNAI